MEIGVSSRRESQCKKPRGWIGRWVLRNMNSRHSDLTDWGLRQISIGQSYTILDVGCGGGRTLSKLAERAQQGKVYGIDYSEESVAASKRVNVRWVATGRVEVLQGSVSKLPFSDRAFDLVTAVETHFWWPNLTTDMQEIFRVVKAGGSFIIIAEVYKGANTRMARLCEKYASRTGMTLLDLNGHRGLFADTGYSDTQVSADPNKGWMCAIGRKLDPAPSP